jgi:hypothetical protein
MHESPAGVAQSAEQPSCKRQASGSIPLTGSQRSATCANAHTADEIPGVPYVPDDPSQRRQLTRARHVPDRPVNHG